MRATIRICLFSILFATTSVSMAGVTVEYASQADFSQYRTFSWIEGTPAEDERVEKMLRKAVTEELRRKGLQMLAEGGDLLVRTHLNLRDVSRQEVDIVGDRGVWQGDVSSATPTGEFIREVGIGTVVVDLLDGHSKLQIWQGVLGQVPQPQTGKRSEQQFNKAVGKLFKKYPPR